MFVVIGILVCATIAVAALILAPRLADGRIVFELVPDRPYAFGYSMSWLAIRTRDTPRLLAALGIDDVQPSNWNTGIGTVYASAYSASHVFISPPLNGWTFVVGLALPHPLGKSCNDKATLLLVDLGREFIEVQFFLSTPSCDQFAWARVIDGRLVRAFATGAEGVVWNKGKPGREEKAIGVKLYELRGIRGRRGRGGNELVLHPTEAHVMTLASKWSLDPSLIESLNAEPALGHVGLAPRRWRSEPLKKRA